MGSSGVFKLKEYITNSKITNNPGGSNVNITPTGATYDPDTGQLALTLNNHGLSVGNKVSFAINALTFSCAMDGNSTNHQYPRADDPVGQGQQLQILKTTTNTFTVNV